MNRSRVKPVFAVAASVALCGAAATMTTALAADPGNGRGGGGRPGGETYGNNLSFPVIWSDGVAKTLRGAPGFEQFDGFWWYWWGTDESGDPLSAAPDPDDPNPYDDVMYPDDGIANSLGDPLNVSPSLVKRVYLQQDSLNEWQADSADWSDYPVDVHWIDWGDNLESVNWYTKSMVRTEVVLTEDLEPAMNQYEMRHLYGWGADEMWGTDGTIIPGAQATVYSHCARLTIQLLLVERDNPLLDQLVWTPGEGWQNPDGYQLISPPIFNKPVWQGGDGPGYYSAEINVKGKVIYGYTWNVRKLHDPALNQDGAGDYRITFSFDDQYFVPEAPTPLNTFFTDGVTTLLLPDPIEGEGGGGTPVLDCAKNLTYIDVRILSRGGGGGGGGNHP